MRKGVFREEALRTAGRVEDLQDAIRVTRPATLLTACALVVSLIGTTVASAFVDVPIHVRGVGVFITASGALIVPATTLSAGYVSEIRVARGDRVDKGDVLARLTLPDREAEVVKTRRLAAAMHRDLDIKRRLAAADAEAERRSTDRQAQAMRTRIAGLRVKVDTLARRLQGLGRLHEDGVISLVNLQTAEIAHQEAVDELSGAEAQLLMLQAERETAASARQREIMAAEAALEQVKLDLEAARAALEADAVVAAAAAGIVTSIDTHLGAMTAPGAPIFEVTPATDGDGAGGADDLRAVVFVELEQGKRVAAGDTVLLGPNDLPEGVMARIVARVVDVAETPASSARLSEVLGDDALVQKIARQGAVFEVTVEPERAADGTLVWRSTRPAGVEPGVGTPLTARVTVEHRPLLALAIPAFRKLLGAGTDAWSDPAG